MKTARIALCQINSTVGDFSGNVEKIVRFINDADRYKPDIIAFPELAITGYPPEDLLLKPQFIEDNLNALRDIQHIVDDFIVIVGFVDKRDDIYNAIAVIHKKNIVDIYHKVHLPNYGVFDEYRYFQAGTRYPVYQMGDVTFGVNICEDIWYPEGPATIQALSGAEFIININASPYHIGKTSFREKMLSTRASDSNIIMAYLNTVGGQDELVFDGRSFVVDHDGNVISVAKQFDEDMIIVDLDLDAVFMKRLHNPRRRQQIIALGKGMVEKIIIERKKRSPTHSPIHPFTSPPLHIEEEVYNALVLGTRDYVRKNGFKKVCIGLSGGIDSSLVATIAVDAIGRDNVTGIFMPSPYTSKESREDAYELAKNLEINIIEVPINDIFETYLDTLKPQFKDMPSNTTEENIQARIRGNILMAFSNKFGWLVLTTGNKSEMSVGYATLYGDMAGGFAVIKDVAKTLVYRICKWKNQKEGKALIPERVLLKEPSAELKSGQKDTDTLPPYEILDPILKAYVEEDKSFDEIINLGCEEECVRKVIKMVDTSEYKRRQSPPGIKITPRAFGRDRRFPITNRYRSW
ncbi:NAD+ synthase [Dissulfurispira thermophila]|uniref:Glutamine-dependent NAD(+) synthetase n=2 Tax=root TaxID=1 RepID=A0A7G1H3V1_9BACT|nr:NAD+ synthase [Dissulfurispira thermophila]BCB96626.1 NAD+ synthase [Dissulfurispira thermophila]